MSEQERREDRLTPVSAVGELVTSEVEVRFLSDQFIVIIVPFLPYFIKKFHLLET